MKSPFAIIFIVFLFFTVVLFFTFNSIKNHNNDTYKRDFEGVIKEIKKTDRNNYQLILKTTEGKLIKIIDRLRKEKHYDIAVGDSLIKNRNTCAFFYKRGNDTIYIAYDACKVIFKE